MTEAGEENPPHAIPQLDKVVSASPAASFRWQTILAIFPALAVTILLLVSLPPRMIDDPGLDNSYQVCIDYAFMHHVRFGIDFIATFGPWGILYDGLYYPGLFNYVIVGELFVAITSFAGIYQLCRNLRMSATASGWWVILVTVWSTAAFGDARLMSMCLIPLLLRRTDPRGGDSPAAYLTIITLALGGLCKFTFLNAGMGVVALLSLEDVIGKRFPKLGIFYLSALLIFWMLAGQAIVDFPTYYMHSLALAKGYMGAMGSSTEHAAATVVIASSFAVFSLVALLRLWQSSRVSRFVTFATFAGIFTVLFKEGFNRHDATHERIVTTGFLLAALICCPLFWSQTALPLSRFRLYTFRIFATVIVLAAGYSLVFTFKQFYPEDSLVHEMESRPKLIWDRAFALADWCRVGNRLLDERHIQAYKTASSLCPLPPLKGTTDMYGYEQAAILAAGLEYLPRPGSTGYQAFSSSLIALNFKSLTSKNAPDTLIFRPNGIDNRLRTLEDGALWPEIISRYSPEYATPTGYLILQKRQQPFPFTFTPLGVLKCRSSEIIDVPAIESGAVWAQIKFEQTFLGTVEETMLRSPPIEIFLKLNDGEIFRFSLVRGMTEDGFVLSPLTIKTTDFLNLIGGEHRHFVSKMSIVIHDGTLFKECLQPAFEVTFKKLMFPPVALSAIPAFSALHNLQQMADTPDSLAGVGFLAGDGGKLNLLAPPPAHLLLDVPSAAKSIHVAGGIRPGAWAETNGVGFAVFTLQADGTKVLLFQRTLNPRENAADRSEFSVDVQLPPNCRRLSFETRALSSDEFCRSYWTDVRFNW